MQEPVSNCAVMFSVHGAVWSKVGRPLGLPFCWESPDIIIKIFAHNLPTFRLLLLALANWRQLHCCIWQVAVRICHMQASARHTVSLGSLCSRPKRHCPGLSPQSCPRPGHRVLTS